MLSGRFYRMPLASKKVYEGSFVPNTISDAVIFFLKFSVVYLLMCADNYQYIYLLLICDLVNQR